MSLRFASGDVLSTDKLNGLIEGTTPLERPALNRARSTVTGNQDNYSVDGLASAPQIGVAYLQWNGASDVTFRGIAGGLDGRLLLIENITAAKVMTFNDNATGTSSAANCLFNQDRVGTQPIGPGGLVLLKYDGTDTRWRLTVLDPGGWIPVTFNAGDYTANGSMTLTVASGDVEVSRYKQIGKMMRQHCQVVTATVGGTPSSALRAAVPLGKTIATTLRQPMQINNNGTFSIGFAQAGSGSAFVEVYKADGSNWAAATNTTAFTIIMEYEVS